jgi:putative salt-induced outer membrane protein
MFKSSICFLLLALWLCSNALAEFKSVDSATVNINGGNTEFKSYTLDSKNEYKFDSGNQLKLDAQYLYAESDDVRSAENWFADLKYFRTLNADQLSVFAGEKVESDRFAGFSRRYNTDLGLKYQLRKTDRTDIFTEIGYRYTVENSTKTSDETKKDNKGRLYIEGSRTINPDIIGKLWIEYIPNFSDSDDYLVNIEPSLIVNLSSRFSLKTAYLWKYDNLPPSDKLKHDYQYNLSLIANF